VAGLGSGIVVLGLGGRLAMRVLALVAGRPTHFGLGASLGIVLIGGILGVLASIGYLLVGRRAPGTPALRGALYGTVLFAVLIPLQPAAIQEEIGALRGHLVVAGLCFWTACVGYGVLLAILVSRWTSARPLGSSSAVA
jgi:hypothetical protein